MSYAEPKLDRGNVTDGSIMSLVVHGSAGGFAVVAVWIDAGTSGTGVVSAVRSFVFGVCTAVLIACVHSRASVPRLMRGSAVRAGLSSSAVHFGVASIGVLGCLRLLLPELSTRPTCVVVLRAWTILLLLLVVAHHEEL